MCTGAHEAGTPHHGRLYHRSTTSIHFCDALNTKNGWTTTLPQPPNGLHLIRAAPIDRNDVRAHLDTKIAPILPTRSCVGCMGGLGHSSVYGANKLGSRAY